MYLFLIRFHRLRFSCFLKVINLSLVGGRTLRSVRDEERPETMVAGRL